LDILSSLVRFILRFRLDIFTRSSFSNALMKQKTCTKCRQSNSL